MLNIKKLFTKLIPKIKTMTGTTDSNGNLSLGLSDSAAKSIIGVTGSNYVYIPFVYAGNWYAKTVSSNSQSTPVVNESVSVSIKYLRGGYFITSFMSTFVHCLGRRWSYVEHKEIVDKTADVRKCFSSIFEHIYNGGVRVLDSKFKLNNLSERENYSGHVPSEPFVGLGSQFNVTCRNSKKSVCSANLSFCRLFGVLRHYRRRWEGLADSNQGSICRSADKRSVYYDDKVTINATISERGWAAC